MKRIITIIVISLIFVVLVVLPPVASLISSTIQKFTIISPIPAGWSAPVIPTVTPTPDPKRPFSVLLLGYGGGNHEGALLTDTMLLARIAPKIKQIWLISIPRDLWISLPVTQDATMGAKINAAYAIGADDRQYPNKPIQFKGDQGAGNMAKLAIETVTGIKPDRYISIDFSGFEKAIDTLGGLDINVTKAFTDKYYPIEGKEKDTCGRTDDDIRAATATLSGFELEKTFTCRFETLSFKTGKQHFDGATALKYARSRHADDGNGDFSRSVRQKEIIKAVLDKVINIGFIPKIFPFLKTVTGDVKSDIPLSDIARLAGIYQDANTYTIHSIALTTDNVLKEGTSEDGQYILMPSQGLYNWVSVRKYIDDSIATTSGSLK